MNTPSKNALFKISPLSLGIASTLLMPVALNASAQDSGLDSLLEEVVVTAQFREQNLQDTPISITAISGDMLAARSQVQLSDVANNAPNVTMSPTSGSFGPSITASVRGIGQYDFNPALEPGVGIYIDDVYYGALTGAQFDLMDLNRVEILRGPQGTLAGKNSIGGAIKMYSKVPTGEESGYFAVTAGRYDRLDMRGSVDFALSENVAVRLSGVSKKNNGYIKRLDYGCVYPDSGIPANLDQNSDCVNGMEGDDDTTAARAMIHITPSDSVDLTIIADTSESESANTSGVLITGSNNSPNTTINGIPLSDQFATGGTYTNYSSFIMPAITWTTPAPLAGNPFFASFDGSPIAETRMDGQNHIDANGLSLKAIFDLNDHMNIESITAYRDYFATFNSDTDVSPASTQLTKNQIDYWQKSQELRLNGNTADSTINYTVGLYYFEQESKFNTFVDIRYTPYPLSFAGGAPSLPAKTKAVFANVGWDVTNDFSLNLGLRYTEEEKTYNYLRRTRDGGVHPILGGLDNVAGRYEGDNVDYRVNLQYRFTENLMSFFSVSTGVKGGGVNPRPFNAEQALSFDQEEVTAYEIGVKTDLLDGHLRLNAAYFFNDYKDIQLTLLSCNDVIGASGVPLGDLGLGTPCALPQNGGSADIQGIELEAMYRLDNGLSIDAAISTLDFEYTELNPALGSSIPKNGITPYTPELKWSLGISKDFNSDFGTFTPRLDASFQDDIYTNPDNAELGRVDDYTLLNAKLTWTNPDSDLEASLGVTNLADKYYYKTKFNLSTNSGVVTGVPGRPREWYLSVKKYF